MALSLHDRVQETTVTAGTGTITLLGAVTGFQSFAVVGDANTCYYTIVDGSDWEVGIGTYSTSGPTLARTTILSNSNGNTSPITLSSTDNTKTVFLTYPAEKSVNLDASGDLVVDGVIESTTGGFKFPDGTTQTTAASGSAAYVRTSFTATAGQDTFSVNYSVGYVEVFINGVLLNADDYTASTGTTVVLTSAASLGDIVELIAYSTQATAVSVADDLAGGTAGQVLYQIGPDATGFVTNGTPGQAFVSAGSSAPAWGTLGVVGGGTGQTSYADGQLLIGNSTGNTLAKSTLTAGTGIDVTNGSGSITIANTGVTAYPGAGLAVSTGSAWGTSKTAPSGDVVGTTDTQTLSGKTITGTKETVYTITDGAAFEIDPANGGIQTVTLGASRTPAATNFVAGQSVTLMIDDGSAYTLTWTTVNPTWVGGSAPTLATSGYTVIEFWKVGSTIYGAYVGTVA